MAMIDALNMKEATRLTREGRLQEAMDLLRGVSHAGASATDARSPQGALGASFPKLSFEKLTMASLAKPNVRPEPFRAGRSSTPVRMPEGASFAEHTFSNAAGVRTYKLYIPSASRGASLPLIVMLHGCTQDPDDFALGTRMNELAEEQGMLVAYPAQPQSANFSKCWNWFNAGEQTRDSGEPSLIAGITREIMQRHDVRPDCVYVAGLSAGGAAASVMGHTYPDLYAAVGVHSGLACGAARDLSSALAAMSQGGRGRQGARAVPTIVFHGDRDKTVHPSNGDDVIAQSRAGENFHITVQRGEVGGVSYTQTVQTDASGRPMLEHWLVHGAGHAWSGGSEAGSFTQPAGPDASREMLRFFRAQTQT